MKSRPKLKPQLEISLSVTFLIFHLSCGHVFSSAGNLNETLLSSQKLFGVMNSTDLRNYGGGDSEYNKHPHDVTSSPGYNSPQVPRLMVEDQVWSLVNDVISRRMRRQSSSDSPYSSHHKRRHRLLLKSGFASDSIKSPNRGRKGRKQRKNFILKSDSEGHIITSASQVYKDWCRTVPFALNITVPRCRTKEVKNNFCYGQCNSFFIPQQSTSKGVAFQSYSNCKPDQIRWTNVTLDCPGQNPPIVSKTVLFVESCRCTAMEGNHHLRHHRHRNARRG